VPHRRLYKKFCSTVIHTSRTLARSLFPLDHILKRRTRAEGRVVARRNLQRRTRLRVSPRSRRARLSSKGSKLGQRHLVARAHRGADDVERGVEHSADARLGLTRLSRDRIDQGLLIQSRGIASTSNGYNIAGARVGQSITDSYPRSFKPSKKSLCSSSFPSRRINKSSPPRSIPSFVRLPHHENKHGTLFSFFFLSPRSTRRRTVSHTRETKRNENQQMNSRAIHLRLVYR